MSTYAKGPVAGRLLRRAGVVVIGASALILAAAGAVTSLSAAEGGRALPPPALDEAVSQSPTETAVLAGGCFWGVQGVYQHVDGVLSAVSGYAGGGEATAHYRIVSTGATGHAESVKVTFDPRRISYGRILQIYFSVAHDPTELNAQGPDTGTQYRSAIFPANPEQARVAKAYIAQLGQAHAFDAAIVTTIEPGAAFYPAEDYHQNFLARNPTYSYIAVNDMPKIAELRRLLPDVYRPDPVLVALAGASD